jgi:hypothetical protein
MPITCFLTSVILTLVVAEPDNGLHQPHAPLAAFAGAKKKYKPIARKVQPMLADLPKRFHIIRNIIGDPLASMPPLPMHPPPYKPTGRYTEERKLVIDNVHVDDFLWPAERDLMHHFMCLQQDGLAWNDSERKHFREDFFLPVEMPTVPHKPWIVCNLPIHPGIYPQVCKEIQRKIDMGIYEPSNSSYRSRWFCVVKKDGTSLHLVQSLEPLNMVMITHTGVPPITEQLVEQFTGRSCSAILDLYIGYDECALAESLRDYTTFQSPYRALQLITLPMGWMNSVPIFHDNVTHILCPEIPHVTMPYIDNVPVKGPRSDYKHEDGTYETIEANAGIQCFVWEHLCEYHHATTHFRTLPSLPRPTW